MDNQEIKVIIENGKIVWKIIKTNWIVLAIIVAILIVGFKVAFPQCITVRNTYSALKQKQSTFNDLNTKYEGLKEQQEKQNREKKVKVEGKVIFEAPGLQFSPEASFAPLFELVMTIAEQSGIRIRAIDYEYKPADDMIFAAKLQGYNSAELKIVAVGTYKDFQTFFKTMMKEKYLTNLAEVEITPWDKDKKILITKFKLRLYTKTM